MSRRAPWLLAALLFACDPKIDVEERKVYISARFDPAASPPVVPTPNDLAIDAETRLVKAPIPETATGADREFYEYLNSLTGFPPSATATATFDGELDPDTVTTESVKIFDVTAGLTPVSTSLAYADVMNGEARGQISVTAPLGGWLPGHTYAIGLAAGANGLEGATGTPVVATATWAFIRSTKPLVTCLDISSPDCRPATEIIPSPEKEDPQKRYNDQGQKALRLEGLRSRYAEVIARFEGAGIKREDLVLAWTFKISDDAQVVFDPSAMPPRVPTPNELATDPATGLIRVPIDSSYSAAYQEFINDYLNTLDGFPVSAAAQVAVAGGDVNPATVIPETVVVLPLDSAALGEPNVGWNAAAKTIEVRPPNGTWGKGRHVAIAVLGRRAADVGSPSAPLAVERVGGKPLVPSSVWALVRSASPLVSCANDDLKSPDCVLAITAAPLTVGQAIQLETLRRLYAGALDALEAAGHARSEVAVLWTFKTVSFPEAVFDPAASIIPFPNNLLRTTGAGAHLNLPVPDAGASVALFQGLNTLDGFSLTAPIISESSDTRGAIDVGQLDPDTLDAGTGFFRLNLGDAPEFEVCLNCQSTLLADGGAPVSPQQLQIVPRVPLTETSPYAAFLTNGLRDLDGHRVIASPTFALIRMVNALCDSNMKSTVPVLTDVQACGAGGAPGLEQLRLGLKPVVDILAQQQGIARRRLALAWAFNTEGTVSELASLSSGVTTLPNTVTSSTALPAAAVFPAGLPNGNVGGVYLGTLSLPFALTGTGGTLRPPNGWTAGGTKAAYMLTVPSGAAPDAGFPLALFGHGLTGHHKQMVAIADALAGAGMATLATDVVWHGERTTCAGFGAYLRATTGNMTATDDLACTTPGGTMADPVAAMCSGGRCVKRTGTGSACTSDVTCMLAKEGYCLGTGFCEGADFVRDSGGGPVANAWNFLNLNNLFAARDNFRHYTFDLSQLVKVVKAGGFATAGGPVLDGTRIHYVGQSLGGFNGTLFSAVNDDVKHVMLNVPGSDQVGLLLTAPGFASVRAGFLGQLRSQGLNPGTPAFDQLMTLFRTIFDKADPQNFAYSAVSHAMTPARRVFIHSITEDTVVPNWTTDKLIAAARTGGAIQEQRADPGLVGDPAANMRCMPPVGSLCTSSRHGFLLNFTDPTTTGVAQAKAAAFLSTGVAP